MRYRKYTYNWYKQQAKKQEIKPEFLAPETAKPKKSKGETHKDRARSATRKELNLYLKHKVIPYKNKNGFRILK